MPISEKDGAVAIGSGDAIGGIDGSGNFQVLLVGADGTLSTEYKTYTTVAVGELAGNVSATQMPNVACKLVKFKAEYDNAGRVYLGGSGVTKADGSTDTTTGLQLSAGEETGWIPVGNLNLFYRICDNAGDDLTYLALA